MLQKEILAKLYALHQGTERTSQEPEPQSSGEVYTRSLKKPQKHAVSVRNSSTPGNPDTSQGMVYHGC